MIQLFSDKNMNFKEMEVFNRLLHTSCLDSMHTISIQSSEKYSPLDLPHYICQLKKIKIHGLHPKYTE